MRQLACASACPLFPALNMGGIMLEMKLPSWVNEALTVRLKLHSNDG